MTSPLSAAPAPSSPGLTFPANGAEVLTLSNGITLLFKEDHSAPVVSAQAWVRTGSILEADLLGTGVSHLVEHMVFQGAGDRGPGELAHAVQDTGGYLNAYTSFDRTVYWIDTLREGLDTALHVLSDLTIRARLPVSEYEKEKDVIRREIDMGKDDPGRTLNHLLFQTVYREHPFREPVIGRLELFNTVERDTAFGYYQQRYTADRTFLVIVGDTDSATVLAMAEKWFADAAVRSPLLLPSMEEPQQTSRREAHVEFTTATTRMELAWRIPGLLHRDTPALEVLGSLLGSGRSSRLWREIRERKALAHSTGAGAYTPVQGGLFYASADCDPAQRAAVEAAMLDQIKALQDGGVRPEEVARARSMFLSEQLHTLTTMRGQASDLGGNWHAASDPDLTRAYLGAIDHVTPEDVQRVARKYLTGSGVTSVSLNPPGSLTRSTVAVHTSRSAEIQRHVFPDGLTLLVREDRRLPLVSLHASLRGGLLTETPATNGLGRLLARSIVKGTGTRSAEEIATLIESGGGSIGADSGGNSLSVSVECMRPMLTESAALWADVLLRPAFASAEVQRESVRQAAAIRQQMEHPSFVAFQELRRRAFGSHPFNMTRDGTPESLTAITAEDILSYHRHHVVQGNTVLSVFGDVGLSEAVDLIGEAFSAMPAGVRRTGESLPALPPHQPGVHTIAMEKQQAFLAAGFPTVPLTHPDRVALDLIDTACSDMASRFFERIREQHGLAYSVGATQILGMAPGLFAFYLSTAPEKVEFAQEELLSEIAKMAAEGLTTAELERARRTWTGQQAMQRQSNAGLAQIAGLDELYGMGFRHSEEILDTVRSITQEEVAAVCARYFSTAPIITRAMPVPG